MSNLQITLAHRGKDLQIYQPLPGFDDFNRVRTTGLLLYSTTALRPGTATQYVSAPNIQPPQCALNLPKPSLDDICAVMLLRLTMNECQMRPLLLEKKKPTEIQGVWLMAVTLLSASVLPSTTMSAVMKLCQRYPKTFVKLNKPQM